MSRDLNEDSLVEAMNEIYRLSKNMGPIVFVEGQEEFARHWITAFKEPYQDPHQRSLTKVKP